MIEVEQEPAPTADLPDDFTSAWATVLLDLWEREFRSGRENAGPRKSVIRAKTALAGETVSLPTSVAL